MLGVNDDGITCELSPELPDYIVRGVDPVIVDMLAATVSASPTSTCGRCIRRSQDPRLVARITGLPADSTGPSWDASPNTETCSASP